MELKFMMLTALMSVIAAFARGKPANSKTFKLKRGAIAQDRLGH
jgi:hypothetical protein